MPKITKQCLRLFKVMQRKLWTLFFPEMVYNSNTDKIAVFLVL